MACPSFSAPVSYTHLLVDGDDLVVCQEGKRPFVVLRQVAADHQRGAEDASLRAIPYFAWGNRGPGEMRVWLLEQAD